jgi:hypothetical protein
MSMDVMWQNRPMRCLAKRLGFEEVRSEDDALIRFRKDLGQTPAASKHKGRKRNR